MLLAASLAVSVCATPVFASGPYNNGQTVQDATGENVVTVTTQKHACTQLKYNVTEGYTWSIPADINFGANIGVAHYSSPITDRVTVKDCRLKKDYTLRISLAGNGGGNGMDTSGGFKVKTVEGAEVGYSVNIKEGEITNPDMTSGDEILSLEAGKNKKETELVFTLLTYNDDANAAEKAGEYIGYAIFTAQATNT